VPSEHFGDALSPRPTGITDSPKYLPCFDFRGFCPRLEFAIDPVLKRDRPNLTAFAAQVYDRLMSLPLLEMFHVQLDHLVTPEAARKQKRQECR
jgi:hypothetical protein